LLAGSTIGPRTPGQSKKFKKRFRDLLPVNKIKSNPEGESPP
jgi:hypothetical protein